MNLDFFHGQSYRRKVTCFAHDLRTKFSRDYWVSLKQVIMMTACWKSDPSPFAVAIVAQTERSVDNEKLFATTVI